MKIGRDELYCNSCFGRILPGETFKNLKIPKNGIELEFHWHNRNPNDCYAKVRARLALKYGAEMAARATP